MRSLNEKYALVNLREFMNSDEGWGRNQGREVYNRLVDFVEQNPGVMIFKVSVQGVKRIDISFASETIVEIARRYRGKKGFCFIDLDDLDVIENWDAAASRKEQPLMAWNGKKFKLLGLEPTQGNMEALKFAMERTESRAAEFADKDSRMSIANASTKFTQLWQQGFLLRRQDVANSGGLEFVYHSIG